MPILDSKTVAEAFGYTVEQLQSIPAESNMGLSCGNPVAAAHIKEVCVKSVQRCMLADKIF